MAEGGFEKKSRFTRLFGHKHERADLRIKPQEGLALSVEMSKPISDGSDPARQPKQKIDSLPMRMASGKSSNIWERRRNDKKPEEPDAAESNASFIEAGAAIITSLAIPFAGLVLLPFAAGRCMRASSFAEDDFRKNIRKGVGIITASLFTWGAIKATIITGGASVLFTNPIILLMITAMAGSYLLGRQMKSVSKRFFK